MIQKQKPAAQVGVVEQPKVTAKVIEVPNIEDLTKKMDTVEDETPVCGCCGYVDHDEWPLISWREYKEGKRTCDHNGDGRCSNTASPDEKPRYGRNPYP